MIYLDTSLLVAAMCPESLTQRVQDWLSKQEGGTLAISRWTLTEFSSALAIKLRTGQIDLDQRAAAFAILSRLVAESLVLLNVSDQNYHIAATFADQQTLALRAGDALHLAIAAGHGATLHTLDRRMAAAGPILGVPTVLLG